MPTMKKKKSTKFVFGHHNSSFMLCFCFQSASTLGSARIQRCSSSFSAIKKRRTNSSRRNAPCNASSTSSVSCRERSTSAARSASSVVVKSLRSAAFAQRCIAYCTNLLLLSASNSERQTYPFAKMKFNVSQVLGSVVGRT